MPPTTTPDLPPPAAMSCEVMTEDEYSNHVKSQHNKAVQDYALALCVWIFDCVIFGRKK